MWEISQCHERYVRVPRARVSLVTSEPCARHANVEVCSVIRCPGAVKNLRRVRSASNPKDRSRAGFSAVVRSAVTAGSRRARAGGGVRPFPATLSGAGERQGTECASERQPRITWPGNRDSQCRSRTGSLRASKQLPDGLEETGLRCEEGDVGHSALTAHRSVIPRRVLQRYQSSLPLVPPQRHRAVLFQAP